MLPGIRSALRPFRSRILSVTCTRRSPPRGEPGSSRLPCTSPSPLSGSQTSAPCDVPSAATKMFKNLHENKDVKNKRKSDSYVMFTGYKTFLIAR